MSREELLRETLRRAAGGSPPAGDAFGRFQAVQRRSARLRMLTAVGVGVGAMIALFMMLPGLGGEGTPANLGASGTSRPVQRHIRQYIDRVAKYEFRYPPYWDGEQVEGSHVALFPDDPALGKRYRTASFGTPEIETPLRFYMIVNVIDDAGGRARLADIDAQGRTGQVTIERSTRTLDGFDTDVRFLTYKTKEPPDGSGVKSWCSLCVIHEYVVHWPDDVVLDVRFIGPDAETFEEHREEIELVLSEFKYYGLRAK